MNKLSFIYFWGLDCLINEQLIVVGNGRCDSPGFCGKYCTYTSCTYKGTDNRNEFNISYRDLEIPQTGETFCFRSFRSYGALCQWKNLDWTNLFCFKRF